MKVTGLQSHDILIDEREVNRIVRTRLFGILGIRYSDKSYYSGVKIDDDGNLVYVIPDRYSGTYTDIIRKATEQDKRILQVLNEDMKQEVVFSYKIG